MTLLVYLLLAAAAASGLLVVATHDPRRQVFALSANGVVLACLFFSLQAPDVALSELAVGVVAAPLLTLVALTATRGGKRDP